MWMSSSTLGTGTLFRGGCCCRREFLERSSGAQAMSRFASWDAAARFLLVAQSKPAQADCPFARSFTSPVSACCGVRQSEPSVIAFAVRSPSQVRAATVPLRFRSSVRALAAIHRSVRSTSCRTRYERSFITERFELSDFGVRPSHALQLPFSPWPRFLRPATAGARGADDDAQPFRSVIARPRPQSSAQRTLGVTP